MAARRRNPFKPGLGQVPPLRVGHEEAIRTLEDRLERICDREQGDGLVLYGPRGNGKTVLLHELLGKAEKRKVVTRTLTEETMCGGAEAVARYIQFGEAEPKRQVKSAGADLLKVGANVALEQPPPPTIRVKLRTLLKKEPVLVAVDEAHVMPVDMGRGLLQTAQDLIVRGMPLLLVLAGTPGVRAHLRGMKASFWERCVRLRVSRFESEDDTRRAIAVPAAQAGMPVDEDALELLVRESQGYPFFIQVLGAAAWDAAAARKGARRVQLRDAQEGVSKADTRRREFYLERYAEAEGQGVLAAATAVSKEMLARGSSSTIEHHELMDILETSVSRSKETALSVRHRLEALGFIWDTPDGIWEPGIPSLCAYFVERDRKVSGKRA